MLLHFFKKAPDSSIFFLVPIKQLFIYDLQGTQKFRLKF